jgi:hypothetical protein
MPSKNIRPTPKTEEDELFDALIGPDEEIDGEAAKEVLEIYGVNSSELVSRLKSRVEADVRQLRSEGKNVSVPMQNALKNLQAATAPPPQQNPMDVDPNVHIDNLLSGKAKAATSSTSRTSLRGRKSGERVTKKDKALLDSIKSEVDEKAKKQD